MQMNLSEEWRASLFSSCIGVVDGDAVGAVVATTDASEFVDFTVSVGLLTEETTSILVSIDGSLGVSGLVLGTSAGSGGLE